MVHATMDHCQRCSLERARRGPGLRIATRTLWLPIGLHTGWNLVTNFLIGPDRLDAQRLLWLTPHDPITLSGRDFGSDVSILTSAMLLTASAALLRHAQRKRNLVPSFDSR